MVSPKTDEAWYLTTAAGELMRSETVRKIGFTGSTRVGKLLMKQAADTVKKVVLSSLSCELQGWGIALV